MLQCFKKNAAMHPSSPSHTEPSAEFKDYKLKLETVSANLRAADTRLDDSKKHWLTHVMDQRAFSAGYADGIADTSSDTYAVAADFAAGASDLYDHWVRESDPTDRPYNKMHRQLKEYLGEIADVEKMYPRLADARSESARYQGKLDAFESESIDDDVRKERNLAKLDSERENFAAVQAEVIDMQKKVYAKSGVAQQMALVAYWQKNAEHVKVMQTTLGKTADFAAENYEALAEIDIATMEAGDEVLSRQASVPGSLPPSPRISSVAEEEHVPVMS